MFSILSISSTTLMAFRCKNCLNLIFRQDDIGEFISYDRNDLGLLHQFNHYPKLQTQADFFVLTQEISYYSSMKGNYETSLVKNYHPFFKMHMFQLTCAQCTYPLGYIVQTVNENTIWLQDRILVDVKSCALLRDSKDQMSKLIKTLRTRLSRKLIMNQENESIVQDLEQNTMHDRKRDIEKLKKLKEKGTILKLEKMNEALQNKKQKLLMKKREISRKAKKEYEMINHQTKNQSLLSTNVSSSLNVMLSKQDTNTLIQSVMISNPINNEKADDCQDDSKPSYESITNEFQFQEEHEIGNFPQLLLTQQQRQQFAYSLYHIAQSIQKKSYFLQRSKPFVQSIINSLLKLSAQQKYVYNKIPTQLITLNSLLTIIRKTFIEKINKKM